MAAGLGETTSPRELIPGEPELIAGDLRDLVAGIQQIGTTGDGLAGIVPAQWSGAAADAFREASARSRPSGSRPRPSWARAVSRSRTSVTR
nr:hypothetical protein [Amycolatopsis methanolica]